ncbi:acyltransferase family protein [Paraburkholderia sp. CNPSo 3157]|uniref:Acyltransferase family protein n=1 Tax=Paraburkholderia franconis TaxID=2654983 RepID=A0A7X1TFQ2_9BURK|nr:acyltransferase [Paraburkholderia franconis]MPW17640.1 acyltransferase family protein [Paraburkholderia franconis]
MPEQFEQTQMPNQKLAFIQALRGVAALMVVLYHGSRFISPYGMGMGDVLFGPAGMMGVALFFIVSGFIMVHTTTHSDGSTAYVLGFLIKRFCRVWPVYAVASLTFVGVVWHGRHFFQIPGHLRQLLYTLLFMPTGNGTPPDFGFPIPSVGWSLNYEMYFYAVFGLSMLFGRGRWIALSVWLSVTLLLIPCLHGQITFDAFTDYRFSHAYCQLLTSPIIWQFAAGVILGLVYRSRIEIRNRSTLKLLLFTAVSFVLWQYMARFQMGHGITQWGLSLIPLMLALVLASKRLQLAAPNALTYLGDISFSLYLWHPLVQEVLSDLFVKMGYGNLSYGYSFLVLTTVVAIVVANVAHSLLERGLSEHLKNWLMRGLCARKAVLPKVA